MSAMLTLFPVSGCSVLVPRSLSHPLIGFDALASLDHGFWPNVPDHVCVLSVLVL